MMNTNNLKKFTIRSIVGLLCLTGFFLTSCSTELSATSNMAPALEHTAIQSPVQGSAILTENLAAGDALSAMLAKRVSSTSSILFTTMVDLRELDKSNSLGRVSMQQIGSRLSQHGFSVLETRLAANFKIEVDAGEFMLTRESMQLLSKSYNAHAVALGVFSEAQDKVFLSVRIVRFEDSKVIAAYEYYLPKTREVAELLDTPLSTVNKQLLWEENAKREQAFK